MMEATRDMLSALPEELLEFVAEHCEEHVISLRVACQELERKSWRVFTKRFFLSRSIWINRASFNTLEAISKYERLAGRVKEVNVHLDEWTQHKIQQDFHPAERPKEDFQAWDKAMISLQEQQFFLRSGQASVQLLSILRSLPGVDALGVHASHIERRLFWPLAHFKPPNELGLLSRTDCHGDFTSNVLLTLLSTLSQTTARIKRLEVAPPVALDCITNMVPTLLGSLSSNLATLDQLIIGVDVPVCLFLRRTWEKSFISFLETCRNVSLLDLSFDRPSLNNDPFYVDNLESTLTPPLKQMSEWPVFPNLKSLKFGNISATADAIIELLERHKQTLKKLDIFLWDQTDEPTGWRSVLQHVLSNHQLDALHLMVTKHENEYEVVEVEGAEVADCIKWALSKEKLSAKYFPGASELFRRHHVVPFDSDSDYESEDSFDSLEGGTGLIPNWYFHNHSHALEIEDDEGDEHSSDSSGHEIQAELEEVSGGHSLPNIIVDRQPIS